MIIGNLYVIFFQLLSNLFHLVVFYEIHNNNKKENLLSHKIWIIFDESIIK